MNTSDHTSNERPSIRASGLVKTSLVDFPGRVCATVFLAGCNFRCPYCHNPQLVLGRPDLSGGITLDQLVCFLSGRRRVLDGVCITGGEPCLTPGLIDMLREIKGLGLEVKLDTNGSCPEVLEHFLREGLLDYVALDVKVPSYKYHIVSPAWDTSAKVEKSVMVLRASGIRHELRTTVVPGLLIDSDLLAIGEWLGGESLFVLQQFRSRITLDPALTGTFPYEGRVLKMLAGAMVGYFSEVQVRGVDRPPGGQES